MAIAAKARSAARSDASAAVSTAVRVGVGIGEATASPSAYSLISDWFPKRLRATALSIYSAGLYVGGGVSLFIGGLIVQNWNRTWPTGGPFGLVGWQAAFMAVGIPGLLVALWIATLREPVRGAVGGLPPPAPHPAPFRLPGQRPLRVGQQGDQDAARPQAAQ